MFLPLRHLLVIELVVVGLCVSALAKEFDADLAWVESSQFDERFVFRTEPDTKVRLYFNIPEENSEKPYKDTCIIVYALPNGNSIEQTLGCKMSQGLDWHYDIQHVAAQVRLLRTLSTDTRIVLVCAEAPGLSWPNFRKTVPDANAKIRNMVNDWRRQLGAKDAKVTLAGHSGGGAFMFGVIDAGDEIPVSIDRIAFLDANYSFDAVMHAEKFARWLKGDDTRRLIVVAYDDREIMFDGKKVVGPTGGTFRATGRMRDALGGKFELTDSVRGPFNETTGLDGRIRFYVHPNPENKILHTALVGEMNGLVHAATLGTKDEETWGNWGGPRAYTTWVQPEPMVDASQRPAPAKPPAALQSRRLPGLAKRPQNAVGGAAFMKSLDGLSLDDREAAILREITSGNFPNFLRDTKTVEIRGKTNDGGGEREVVSTLDVMPDYLAVGSDRDFVRMPVRPQTAQRIADQFGCVLPTRKMVDAIDAAAEVHVAPHPLTEEREAVATFAEHNQIIRKQIGLRPDGQLVTGIKKDIVLTPRIFERPQRLAIYGWRQLDGKPIQPLTIVHWDRYVDYSHGARLVRNAIEVDGKTLKIDELLADPARCGLVSDEGPMNPPRYPLD
jgi:hypothetical protein